ncbi:MAG: HIT family protein [bacterium]|nr:HIT family protein [bacterium]
MRPEVLTGFGYPDTLVHEYDHWVVLAAPRQLTLGAMLVVCRDGTTTLGAVSDESWNEFPRVIRAIEATVHRLFQHDRMNVLFLMMAVPEVHAAIIPRYAKSRVFNGTTFTDPGWPRKPDLDAAHDLDPKIHSELVHTLRGAFVSTRVHTPL